MYRSILVPLDGSQFAEQALPWALTLAAGGGDAHIHLLLVHQTVDLWDAMRPAAAEEKWRVALRTREEAYLAGIVERLREAGSAHVHTALADGPVAPTIATWARSHDVEVIVMTTHAQSGAARAWLGGVTDGVIRHGSVPVFVVRPEQPAVEITPPRALPARIFVAWDGTEHSARALDHARRMADASGGELVLAHVVPQHAGPSSPFLPHAALLIAEAAESRRKGAQEELDGVVRRLADAEPPFTRVRTLVSEYGSAARGLLQMAETEGADLIAVGTHGRGGVTRTLLGSVADKIIRGAPTPVLVCRQRNG
jgi:nucleotide-binding universal stress UspA family protein